MDNELIPVETFYLHYQVEESFINELYDLQLLTISTVGSLRYIAVNQLPEVEKLIRLHHDFNLPPHALAVASHLLQKVSSMQNELQLLRGRLRLYEDI